MLSDKQVNDLENLIVFSTMDNLPLILSRAIPLLFSELRLVRATLDSKVGDFLGGIHDQREEVGEGAGDSGLPPRHEPVEAGPKVSGDGHAGGDQAVAGEQGEAQERGDGTHRRKRGRPKKAGGSVSLDTGASQQEVGGEADPAQGFDSLLGIEATPRLKGGA